MDNNRRLAELLGMCWHEQISSDVLCCKHCGKGMLFQWDSNPDFATDPRLVLREMRKRTDIEKFYQFCCKAFTPYLVDDVDMTVGRFIDLYILDTTGKLCDAAIGFLEKEAAP